MRKYKNLKSVASLIASSEEIPEGVMRLLKSRLTKSEFKLLIKLLRLEIHKRHVAVASSSELSLSQKKILMEKYAPLKVTFDVDSSLGGGIRVIAQDTVLDMSIKHYIIHMVQKLSE